MPRGLTEADNQALNEFKELILQNRLEGVYQSFLEKIPRLIPQEFVQNHGVHFSVIFKKLKLAENYITDFFYLSKSSADWNIVFVEIEKPSSRYFKDNSDSFHKDFLSGLEQMNTWRAWANENSNIMHMLNETLEPIWQPVIMRSNPIYPKYVLVTGRRNEFENDRRRRQLIQSQERDDFKIISYDSLSDGYETNQPVYIATRTNSHIKILSNEFVSESILALTEPSRLMISRELHDNAIVERESWQAYKSMDIKALDIALPLIQIFED